MYFPRDETHSGGVEGMLEIRRVTAIFQENMMSKIGGGEEKMSNAKVFSFYDVVVKNANTFRFQRTQRRQSFFYFDFKHSNAGRLKHLRAFDGCTEYIKYFNKTNSNKTLCNYVKKENSQFFFFIDVVWNKTLATNIFRKKKTVLYGVYNHCDDLAV